MMRPADPLRLNPDRLPDSGSTDFILAAAEGCLERALLSAAFDFDGGRAPPTEITLLASDNKPVIAAVNRCAAQNQELVFRSSFTVLRISRESASSDTARASTMAPTSALKVKIAFDLAACLSLPGSKPASN